MKTYTLKELMDSYDENTQAGIFNEYVPASVARGPYEALYAIEKESCANNLRSLQRIGKLCREALAAADKEQAMEYGREVKSPSDDRCVNCGSHCINPHLHGREDGIDLDLCDVCYWRARAEPVISRLARLERVMEAGKVLRGASRRVGEENYTPGEPYCYDEHYRNPWEEFDVAIAPFKED